MEFFKRVFNPDSVFKKEDGSLIPLNDARRILMGRAEDMDDIEAGEYVTGQLKKLGYNLKDIKNQSRPAQKSQETQ